MPAKFERASGDVDVLDEVVPLRACALLLGQPNDQGDADAFFIEKLFAAQVADAVVGPKEDRSRVQSFQPSRDPPGSCPTSSSALTQESKYFAQS